MTPTADRLPEPAYGWYGDDLTGATDTLATIARRNQRAFLFLAVPSPAQLAAAGKLDAVGIAGAARTMNPDEMRDTLPAIGRFFSEIGVRLIHYKCCSTFDSAVRVGNLAVAIAVLQPFAATSVVPVVGGQPSLGRFCVFSNLYASGGDRVHRIDRHPTMSRHPATPMHEADLVRHFDQLGLPGVASIHWPAITSAALEPAWQEKASGAPAILLDVLDDGHLTAIGQLLLSMTRNGSTLVVGASSVAEAWFAQHPQVPAKEDDMGEGPVFAFVGSLSPVTRAQIAATKSYAVIQITPDEIDASSSRRAAIISQSVAALAAGGNVMVSTAPLDGEAPVAFAPGLAEASASLIDDVLRRSGVRRLAIAGGDTSTIAVTSLGFWGLAYHGLASRGVTICRGRSDDPWRDGMLVMLKGGQMGDARVFDAFAASAGDSMQTENTAPITEPDVQPN